MFPVSFGDELDSDGVSRKIVYEKKYAFAPLEKKWEEAQFLRWKQDHAAEIKEREEKGTYPVIIGYVEGDSDIVAKHIEQLKHYNKWDEKLYQQYLKEAESYTQNTA